MDDAVSQWPAVRHQVLQRDGFCCVSCGASLRPAEADIHHLLPRSMGGTDELSNLVSLCDGCHAAHHPTLAGGLARRLMEQWAIKLARWLDREGEIVERTESFGPALRIFGVERFRSGQLQIVLAALSRKSILVVSPTGSGKTLCFQLPAILRTRVSVVVSPLKTLMTDQVSSLLRKKIPATFINSDLSSDEKNVRFEMLLRGAYKFLYVAPERFFVRNHEERKQLAELAPSFLVVDEAHCVDQWGKDFRPEYGRINDVRKQLNSPPVLAFTATAGKEMQHRILTSLGIPNATVFVRDVDRPNITLARVRCSRESRAQEVAELLAMPVMRGQKTMVFVPSRKVGEELKKRLSNLNLDVPFYHSKFGTPFERQELLKRFTGESRPIVDHIVCTNAFGMGLDIPNVRLVIHWQQPASVEDLLQEFGRAGRDRKAAVSVIFHDGRKNDDRRLLKFMADKTVESAALDHEAAVLMRNQRYRQIDQVAEILEVKDCFRQAIRSYFGDAVSAPRPGLAMRLVDWIFGTKTSAGKSSFCCDYCDSKSIERLGLHAYVARVVTEAR